MGENPPEVMEIHCPSCETRFRLRLIKGRLPSQDIECPSCGASIPVEPQKPKAAILKRSTEIGAPKPGALDPDTVPTGGTLLGLPVDGIFAPPANPFDRQPTVVKGFSDPPPDPEPNAPRTPLGDLEEHSDSAFQNTTRHPWDTQPTTKAQTLETSTSDVENTRDTPYKGLSSISSSPQDDTVSEKPKLNDLLKKVREKRGVPLPAPPEIKAENPLFGKSRAPQRVSADTDNRKTKPSMEPAFRKKMQEESASKENAPGTGTASETRGSGYIRLPTSEIKEALGEGEFDIRIGEFSYSVSEDALVKLVKGGILMGAEEMAAADGVWMPINEHPVVKRLREKMADEAHLLLADIAERKTAKSRDEPRTEELTEDFLALEDSPPPLPEVDDVSDAFEATFNSSDEELIELDADEALSLEKPPQLPAETSIDSLTAPLKSPDEIQEALPPEPDLEPEVPEAPSPEPLETKTSLVPPAKKKGGRGLLIALVLLALVGGAIVASYFLFGDEIKGILGLNTEPTVVAEVPKDTPPPPVEVVEETPEPVVPEPEPEPEPPALEPHEAALAALQNLWDNDEPNPDDFRKAMLDLFENTHVIDGVKGTSIVKINGNPTILGTWNDLEILIYPDTPAAEDARRRVQATAYLCSVANCGVVPTLAIPASLSQDALKDLDVPDLNLKDGRFEAVIVVKTTGAIVRLPAFQGLWRGWMRASSEELDKPLAQFQADLAKELGDEPAAQIVSQAKDMTLREFMQGVSATITFDYLTNNSDRFDGDAEDNLVLRNGVFFTQHHVGTFQPRASTRVKGRFSWAPTLDKSSTQSLLALTPDINDALFPNTRPAEKVYLDVFWSQHEKLSEKAVKEPWF